MSDSNRPSGREIERDLRDLGGRIEYPPTPDLARAVSRRLEEEEGRPPRGGFWPSLLSPRWAVPAAALMLISFALLSPAVRELLPAPSLFGQAAGSGDGGAAVSEDGGSAARPESGGSAADRPGQQAKTGSQASRSPVAGGSGDEDRPESGGEGSAASESSMAESESARAGATGCPAPSLEVEPAQAAPGATFRLRGNGFSSGCDEIRPAHDVRITFRQDGKTWKLATADADRGLTFDVRLRVPAGARAGAATVSATTRSGERTEERFGVLRR